LQEAIRPRQRGADAIEIGLPFSDR